MNLETGGDVEKFIHEWETIATKLEHNNFVFDRRFKVFLLLGGLPEEYHPLVVALESRYDLEMTYVKGRLIDEYKRMNEKAPQNEKLLLAKQREHGVKKRSGTEKQQTGNKIVRPDDDVMT